MLKRMYCVFGVVFGMLCLGGFSAQGQTYYVRAGANGNGSDWNNAFSVLPATLVRGATYYVAGGSYPSYTMNTAQSGTTVITVKKATVTDHGTDAGWVSSYGTSQAVFASQFRVYRGYFVLDGSYRDESDWFNGAAYGFKIQHSGDFTHLIIRDVNGNTTVPNVTIKYLYVAAQIGKLGSRPYAIDCDTFSSTIRNPGYVISRVYVEGSNNPFFVRNTIDPLIEYCASEKTCGDATYHGEVVNRFYSSNGVRGGGIVRYCHFRNCYDGTSGYPRGGGTGVIAISETSGMEIYGNIFESYYVGDGAIAAGWVNNNIKVYNNTFVNGVQGSGALVRFTSTGAAVSGNIAQNNLAVNCPNSTYNGAGTFANNGTDSTSVFVNHAAGDYRLARHTASGVTLSSPFNTDFAGNLRGTDGIWDLGAYQYGSTSGANLTANAGQNQTITLPNNATLVGTYVNLLGGTPTVGWSKVSGPGTVGFSAANSATTSASFSSAGTYVIRFTVTVSAVSASDDVTITVQNAPDSTAPTVVFSGPSGVISNSVTLNATANDNIGVAGVRFFVSGSLLSDDTTSPYSFAWDTRGMVNGSYQIYAQARDAAGNVGWSSTNTVTVANPPAALPTPAAHWTFSETAGSTATDSEANNVLTLRNGTTTTGVGKFGTGLVLDGVDNRADAPNSTSLNVNGTTLTVATWIKLESQNTWQQILVKVKETGAFTAPYFAWHLFGGHASSTQWTPMFQVVNASAVSGNASSSANVNYGEWVHVAGVYDGANVRIYVNGVERGSAPLTGNVMSYAQPLYVGAHGQPGEFAKGVIDEVRIYSQALSAAQVQTLASFAPGGTVAPPTGLRVVQGF